MSTGTKNKKYKVQLLCAAMMAVSLVTWSFKDDLFQISKNLDVFASLYREVNINYVDDINTTTMMKTGVDAMLENLDPYTEFVPEADIEDYKLHYVSTQYGGVGASIFTRNNKVYLSDVFEGFPAQKADLRAGDQLISINDIVLNGKNNDEVSQLLKGPKGGAVKLTIKRGDAAPFVKNVVRDEIKQPNVSYYGMLSNNVGYIKLDKFLERSADEVTNALTALKKNNPTAIILDLRSNGGGILQEAVKIVNLFVAKNVKVVSQIGKLKEKSFVYTTQNQPVEPDLPLAVLINSRSASASEIVAGSLQDLDRAVVIGQRSFGKGLVQQSFSLPYNNLVKITVAKYYTASGRCVQELDYAHRKKDGSVLKVADSLIHEFKTQKGRTVFDGSGVYPDLMVEREKFARVTQALVGKLLVFDYATQYKNSHPTIADAKSFKLTDAEYNDFVKYLAGKDYKYTTISEKLLDGLKDEATKEKQFNEIQNEYETLRAKLQSSKENDLTQHKQEIKELLENEISARYYYEKGRYETHFKYDHELAEALKTLGDKQLVAAILNGDGQYKTIGKPSADMLTKAATNNADDEDDD